MITRYVNNVKRYYREGYLAVPTRLEPTHQQSRLTAASSARRPDAPCQRRLDPHQARVGHELAAVIHLLRDTMVKPSQLGALPAIEATCYRTTASGDVSRKDSA